MKCQMERFNPVKIFRNRRNAFEGSFFVSTEMTGISCTIYKNLTRAILSPTVDNFVNLDTSRPSLPISTGSFLTNGTASYFDPLLPEEINCSICPKNHTRKFRANGKALQFPSTKSKVSAKCCVSPGFDTKL